MSSYVQPRRQPRPDDYTNVQCSAPICTTYVQEQFYERRVYLCQEHALAVWASVQEMVDPGSLRRRAFQESATPEELDPEITEAIPRNELHGTIYYLRVGELIKIGFTEDLGNRMKAYPPDCEVLASHNGAWKEEQELHSLLTVHRAKGREWYRPTEEVMEYVERARARNKSEQLSPKEMESYRKVREARSKRWHNIPAVIP